MTDPERRLRGITHLSLSVRDLDASSAFYHGVLGLPVLTDTFEGTAFEGRECMLLVGRTALCLQEHAANLGAGFDPARAGLDHVAFAVETLDELEGWAASLTASGVDHSGVKVLTGFGHMIEARDPDGMLVELHCLPKPG